MLLEKDNNKIIINNFNDCVLAGNPVMESYPRQCRADNRTFVEEITIIDKEENDQVKEEDKPIDESSDTICTTEYRPVCGTIQIQCITTPCDPIQETFSNECVARSRKAYNITEGACPTKDVILDFPKPNTIITSPLVIKGQARGSWFFEASFPIVLTNWDGLIIGEGYAMTKDDWMTTDFVNFEGTITFTKPDVYDYGFLILKKDNPSGLPEFDDALEIPVKF